MLTFDDGPTEVTAQLGKILKERGISGTFFVVAQEASKYRETLEELKREGHFIGYHCYKHVHPLSQGPITRYRELEKGLQMLEDLGIRPKLYRPPHGFYTLADMIFMKRRGLTPCHWYSLLGDWENPGQEVLLKRLRELQGPGRVLVLHDGSRGKAVAGSYREIPEVVNTWCEEVFG